MKPDGYAIRDTETGEWFHYNGRRMWFSSGAAKNAWNGAHYRYYRGQPKFTEQTRFVCLPVKLTALEIE